MSLNRFQKFVARVCKITPFDIEKALRDALHKGIEITEKKYAERTMVWIDPHVQLRGYPQTAAYDAPSPTTDGKMRAERMDNAQFIEQIHTQHALPAAISPLRKSKLAKLIHDAAAIPGLTAPEDDWTNGGVDQTARHQAAGRNTGKAEM